MAEAGGTFLKLYFLPLRKFVTLNFRQADATMPTAEPETDKGIGKDRLTTMQCDQKNRQMFIKVA